MTWWFILSLAIATPSEELVRSLKTGDCEPVLKAQPTDDAWPLAVAHCALKLERPELGIPALKKRPTAGLEPWHALLAARAYRSGWNVDPPDLKSLRVPKPFSDELLTVRLAIAIGEKRLEDALRLQDIDDTDPERQFMLAEALADAGRGEESSERYRILWSQAPTNGWGERALSALTEMGMAPDPVNDEALYRTRANSLAKRNAHADALTLLLSLAAVHPPDTPADKLALAKAHFLGRSYADAQAAYRDVLGPPDKPIGRAGDLYQYGLSHARTGDYATAATIYSALVRQHPDHKKADLASYKLGYMAVDRKDCAEGIRLLKAHRVQFPDSRHLDEALWFEARCHWRQGDFEQAETCYQDLTSKRPRSSLASGAAYWRARALGKRGDTAAEQASLERVIETWPVSGWSWFAAQRTGRVFPQQARYQPGQLPSSLASSSSMKRAQQLLEVGLTDFAKAELRQLLGQVKGDREASLALGWQLLRSGDYRQARRLAAPYCTSVWKKGDASAQQLCTPLPEVQVVEPLITQYELEPWLPYGIMTAESALDPSVTSIAGARGLMQLMPKEAKRLHPTVFASRTFAQDDLYLAAYNATLGTTELGQRTKSLDGALQHTDLPAVIASYNGGETAVRRWIGTTETPEFDEFAEDIGYTETRRYVKRVLGFIMAYRWVYGDPKAPSED